ncbi:mannose-6-phosphate isomerase, class I [Tissierella sp. Yu-01]|uniref:mannose-6-phosphate isomerase, class I n=1 Tax=Tissierella sp. Yu-01 TaxID=3035694 RepID=UPI00240D543C|nr:mannose-6-phosphate isomerase, class I [Tissierella sp. Yu-01]WFA08088.1 mannose-6-phosphate isomerase, class I [Tissierella sp. Yu-01]
MTRKVIFFNPIYKNKVWGGECWVFSAHTNGQSVVRNGEFKGKTLGELWEENREIFGNISGEKFPLLVKIIDAKEDLSVQVHPTDEYAKKHENEEFGKTECWYILDCGIDAKMVLGINAESKEELDSMIDKGKWADLLQTISIEKGDFFYVPSGTVHALKSGTLVLEIQQNSDTTYRLYDYDRTDEDGNLRELHVKKSKDVIEVPYLNKQPIPIVENVDGMTKIKFIESLYFTVEKYEVKNRVDLINKKPFMLMSVIEGKGVLKVEDMKYPIEKGEHLMLSSEVDNYTLEGAISIIVSYL